MHADNKYTAKKLTIYEMQSYFRVIITEMYVISTLNFKKCVSFNVTITNIEYVFTVYNSPWLYACRTKDFRSCLLGYTVEQLLYFLCFFDQSILFSVILRETIIYKAASIRLLQSLCSSIVYLPVDVPLCSVHTDLKQ